MKVEGICCATPTSFFGSISTPATSSGRSTPTSSVSASSSSSLAAASPATVCSIGRPARIGCLLAPRHPLVMPARNSKDRQMKNESVLQ